MASSAYRILDEPTPGALSRYVVQPFWPLLSLMLGGAWIAWPWFVFNAIAVGSATLRQELWLVLGALLSPVVLGLALSFALTAGMLPEAGLPYARLGLYVCQIGFGYLLFDRQQRSVALFEHFRGAPRNGVVVALGAALANGAVDRAMAELPWWIVVALR